MKINSYFTRGAILTPVEVSLIKTEPMLHRADREFAMLNGGNLTREFLSKLEWNPDEPILIDSRVHMLMPGMYPCIPGWHHDDVPRERSDKQPNYETPSYQAEHCLALWGDCSLTEFAIGELDFEIPPLGQKIYKIWSPLVESLCIEKKLTRVIAPERQLIYFNWQTWHRGAETTKPGFRFFIRATRKSNLPARNEIRYNANVYMPLLEEGW